MWQTLLRFCVWWVYHRLLFRHWPAILPVRVADRESHFVVFGNRPSTRGLLPVPCVAFLFRPMRYPHIRAVSRFGSTRLLNCFLLASLGVVAHNFVSQASFLSEVPSRCCGGVAGVCLLQRSPPNGFRVEG
jgi:hypothetical protein